MNDEPYLIHADRDELRDILIGRKLTIEGALGCVADNASIWGRIRVYRGDTCIAYFNYFGIDWQSVREVAKSC